MSAPQTLLSLSGLCLLGLPAGLGAQRTWQADIRIKTLEVQPVGQASLSVRIQVTSDDRETARESRLEILVPVGLDVLRVGPGCRPSASALANVTGRVTCELGDIPVRGLREVMLVTSRPPAANGARFAAFVMSSTPDPVPTNNYAERAIR